MWLDELLGHIPGLTGRRQAVGLIYVLPGFGCSLWDACVRERAGGAGGLNKCTSRMFELGVVVCAVPDRIERRQQFAHMG